MDADTLEKIWNIVKQVVGVFGVPFVVLVIGGAVFWYVIVVAEKQKQKIRDDAAAEQRRKDELHANDLRLWQMMALQNNAIAERSQMIGATVVKTAQVVAEKMAPNSQQDQP